MVEITALNLNDFVKYRHVQCRRYGVTLELYSIIDVTLRNYWKISFVIAAATTNTTVPVDLKNITGQLFFRHDTLLFYQLSK